MISIFLTATVRDAAAEKIVDDHIEQMCSEEYSSLAVVQWYEPTKLYLQLNDPNAQVALDKLLMKCNDQLDNINIWRKA